MDGRTSLFLAGTLCIALGLGCTAPLPDVGSPVRPNVIVFLVDDLGWHDHSLDLGVARSEANRHFRTPNLERLAARGVTFRHAYAAAPVCTPSRTSLMTGLSPGRSRITYWTLHADSDTSAPYPGLAPPDWNLRGLSADDVTLPKLLQEAGYRTVHVGKAHFGAIGTSGSDPRNLGFDVNVAGHAAGAPGSYLGLHDFSDAGRRGEGGPSVWDVPGLEADHGTDVYLTDVLAREARNHVSEAVRDGVPFFLHLAPYAVHTPIQAHDARSGSYAELDAREAAYASMVETVDAALGSLLDHLDELDVTQETVVVFSSDNGGLSAHARGGEAHTHNAPLRSGKGSAYEGGVRVPQVIAWPGVTDRPFAVDTPTITHDLFPTVLGWTGVEAPADHAARVDGRDLRPLLHGAVLPPRALVWHQPHFWGVEGPGIWPYTALREGRWKLVFRHADRAFELYDLAHDPAESTDVCASHPELVRELAERMSVWFEATGAQPSLDEATREPLPLPREFAP